nr:immunoglobulin heavy chain junction region [Macaca mulatta]MOV44191.1 immunoglobulin heavy chain junction region [Macaca mulatta]
CARGLGRVVAAVDYW